MGERGAANEPATDDDIAQMATGRRGRCRRGRGRALREPARAAQGRRRPRGTGHVRRRRGDLWPSPTPRARDRPTRCSPRSCPRPRAPTAPRGTAKSTGSAGCRARPDSSRTLPVRGGSDGAWRDKLGRHRAENAAGARIVPQVGSHRQGLLCGLRTVHPFVHSRTYQAIADLPVAERARRMADPAIKATIMAEAPSPKLPRFHELMLSQAHERLPVHPLPEHEPDPATSLAAQAEAARPRSRRPPLRLDHRRRRRRARALLPRRHTAATSTPRLELLAHPATVLGLGDGGAHVDLVCDAGYPSFVLWYWVRDARARHAPARDRDPRAHERARPHVRPPRPRRRRRPATRPTSTCSTPTRSSRTRSRSCTTCPRVRSASCSAPTGTSATIVPGEVVQRDGDDTGARPGGSCAAARPCAA